MAERSQPILIAVLLLCLAATATIGSAATGSERPSAGAYEITTVTTYTDVPLPDTTITTTSCLSQADLDRDPASALAALPDGASCEVVESVMDAGVIEMRIVCDTQGSSMTMVTTGTYDTGGWSMISDVTVAVGDDEVKMHATITGRRTGDC
ncbi:MAG: DUF3617 domain-containing protein [Pseudomonadales bacterium]